MLRAYPCQVDLENELEELKQSKEAERKKHKDKIYELEREIVKEKERLKKELDEQIHEARLKILETATAKLHSTTKLTMIENDKMNSEIQFQSKQTEGLIEDNIKIKEENRLLKRKLELSAQLEDELSKKNQANQTIIKELSKKLQGSIA